MKVATVTSSIKKQYDESFEKNTVRIHPTIIPFLTSMNLSHSVKQCKNIKWNKNDIEKIGQIQLRPLMAPVNHNSLDNNKTLNIVHTMLGNFCHGSKDKISHMEDMGNDTQMFIGYNNKVCFVIKLFNA